MHHLPSFPSTLPPLPPHLQIHVLQEDWSDESVQLVTSCWVTDVNDISVDRALPLYCTIVSLHTPSHHPHSFHSSTHAVTPSLLHHAVTPSLLHVTSSLLHITSSFLHTSHPHSSTHAVTPSLLPTHHHTLTPPHTHVTPSLHTHTHLYHEFLLPILLHAHPFHTQSYDQGLWLVCFSSEYELGKFESALAAMWKEQFQVSESYLTRAVDNLGPAFKLKKYR